MKFKFLFILSFLLLFTVYVFADKSILYITDNTHMSDVFNTKCVDMLQSLADDDYGKGQVNIVNVSKFDMNTTQCLELFDTLYSKKHQDAIMLMIGDSNYHNLYGFSSYIKDRDKDKPIIIKPLKNIYEINNEMLKKYAPTKKSTLTKIVGNVYNTLLGAGKDVIFEPKVIPNFQALNKDFTVDDNIIASMSIYVYAWDLIRKAKYYEAISFLQSIIEKKPSQSMLYYALGSAYLSEHAENCEQKALQCFEDGILVDPLNKDNLCYKGLVFLYMMYEGEITAEVLFFVRELSEYITFPSDDMEAILNINTVDYNEKLKVINSWILSDMEKLKNKAIKSNTKLIFINYPDDIPVNSLISEYVRNSSRVFYIENKFDIGDNLDFIVYRIASKIYDFFKKNNIIG